MSLFTLYVSHKRTHDPMADIPFICSFSLTALINSPFSVKTWTLPSSNTSKCPSESQDTSTGFSSWPCALPCLPKHWRDLPELAEYIRTLKRSKDVVGQNDSYQTCYSLYQLQLMPSHPLTDPSHPGRPSPARTPGHPPGHAALYRTHVCRHCQVPATNTGQLIYEFLVRFTWILSFPLSLTMSCPFLSSKMAVGEFRHPGFFPSFAMLLVIW